MKEYNVHEVLAILKEYNITHSQQMVTKWIRQGKIKGTRSENRKEGYMVSGKDLLDFIEEQRPGWPNVMEVYDDYIEELRPKVVPEIEIHLSNRNESRENNVKYMSERISSLETKLSELQAEKQLVEKKLIEIMDDNIQLRQKVNNLQEERLKTFESQKAATKNVNSARVDRVKRMTFDQFKENSGNVVKDLMLDVEGKGVSDHFVVLYQKFFNEGTLRSELVNEDGLIKCPFTGEESKQFKRILKKACKFYFENLKESKEQTEQDKNNKQKGQTQRNDLLNKEGTNYEQQSMDV
ncbi:hypothetical protein A8F94_05435 [Bacillus sp. FJAT-27225]|uniref:helix-turn-helix domain-containing protein n=1 Tax=Bacillus sp. FJAT-27225 TaxID=1743144 RepID=UPI00080C2BDE|nr:helix-turn-helix domain-containing protein [Bacillus sp. FJAT-27225]OCA91303.1 hypothetical protein A8F94_05435 [Bacillus sp. FJAT-27225]